MVERLDLATATAVAQGFEKINERLSVMSDAISTTLNGLATRITDELKPALIQLINDDKEKAARLAELEGTEVAQSEAADRVKAAVDGLAADLTASPDAPDVEPLPEIPAEPTEPVADPDAPVADGGDQVSPTDPAEGEAGTGETQS